MDFNLEDVTDPSDFPVDDLRKLDNSLRCPICKDFYDGPIILHCGHTFCSLCIRMVLPSKPECPTCRIAASETHIVRNAIFSEAVRAWSAVRPLVLKYSTDAAKPVVDSAGRGKRKLTPTFDSMKDKDHVRPPRKSARHNSDQENVLTSDPDDPLPDLVQTNSPVVCPICSHQIS